jgi:tetratricopeptide (TPR) repeat protein
VSRNYIKILFLLPIIIFTLLSSDENIKLENEDELIMRALWHAERNEPNESYDIFDMLYKKTGSKQFLFKKISLSLMGSQDIEENLNELEQWIKQNPHDIESHRLILSLYLTQGMHVRAEKEIGILLSKSDDILDMEIASNAWLYLKKPIMALELLSEIYTKSKNDEIVARIASLYNNPLMQRQKAINILKEHERNYGFSEVVSLELLDLYAKDMNVDAIIETTKKLYHNINTEHYLQKVLQAYFIQKDIKGAIEFLETNEIGESYLLDLYRQDNQFDKAITLLDKFYKKDRNPQWIAQKAIMIYEGAKDKKNKEMIERVIENFEKAFDLGVNDAIYLNYYGYTLIDNDVEIQKGLSAVKRAVFKDITNYYYLDSLAWGFYKMQDYNKAYRVMKRVVEIAGTDEPEVELHWTIIQKSYKATNDESQKSQ